MIIGITKTKLKTFEVTYHEDGDVSVDCCLGLCTEAGREVAAVTMGSSPWRGRDRMELPRGFPRLAMALGSVLHEAAEKQIVKVTGLLTEG